MDNYEAQAEQIRNEFCTLRDTMQNDPKYTEAHKTATLKAEREKALEKMTELRKANNAEKVAKTQSLANTVFERKGSELEYLNIMKNVETMNAASLEKFIDSAVSINADEVLRAIGRSAFNREDLYTLQLLRDKTSGNISKGVGSILDHLLDMRDAKSKFANSMAFTLPGF